MSRNKQQIEHVTLDYEIEDQKNYGQIVNIKNKNALSWKPVVKESQVKLIFTYRPMLLTKIEFKFMNLTQILIKVYSCESDIVKPHSYKQIFKEKDKATVKILQKDLIEQKSAKIQLTLNNIFSEDITMELIYFLIYHKKQEPTSQLKDRILNLSKEQQFKKQSKINNQNNVYSSSKIFQNRAKFREQNKSEPNSQNRKLEIITGQQKGVNHSDYDEQLRKTIRLSQQVFKKQQQLRKKQQQFLKEIICQDSHEFGVEQSANTILIQQSSQIKQQLQIVSQSRDEQIPKYKTKSLTNRQKLLLSKLTQNFKKDQIKQQESRGIKFQDRVSNVIEKKVFSGQPFSIAGYQNPKRAELIQLGRSLGLNFVNDLCDNSYLISQYKDTNKTKAAQKQFKGVLIVKAQFLYDCQKSQEKLDHKKYSFS